MVRTRAVWLVTAALVGGCGGETSDKGGGADCGDMLLIYTDADGDGYGDPATAESACGLREGWVAEAGDCDDDSAAVHPGIAESCNGVDDNCDGQVDVDAVDAVTGYLDADGDGYGDDSTATARCALLADEVAEAGDCDDSDATVSPAAEDLCDEEDRDCDGEVDVCPDAGWTRAGADLSWTGRAAHDATGAALAVVADEAGDALLVGAPEHDRGSDRGAGAVVLVAAAGGALAELGWLTGGEAGAHLGAAVASVDGEDGPLLAVSAPGAAVRGLPRGGVVYLLSGPALGDGDAAETVADTALHGPAAWTGAGTAVVSAGDSNGDGIEDLLVAAGASDGAGERRGEVWLVQPPPGGLSGDGDLDAFPRWEGLADHDGLGAHQGIAAGDLNGDGVTDLILGAFGHDREAKGDERIGGIWVVEGREPEFPLDNALDDAEAFVEGVIGEDETWFGAALLSPGDLDGDGYDEVAISAHNADGNAVIEGTGEVYLLDGDDVAAGGVASSLAHTTIYGEADYDGLTVGGESGFDLDGDGIDELMVVRMGYPGQLVRGAAYVFNGTTLQGGGVHNAQDASIFLESRSEGDWWGISAAGWDMDSDGDDDLLIGGPNGSSSSGMAAVFLSYFAE
jgi:hypothetical protein